MTKTIQQLRKTGYKVRVIHKRNYVPNWPNKLSPGIRLSSKGGYTRIDVTIPDGSVTVSGESRCSINDSYNRKLGNSIALGRALSQLNNTI
jgi:hypothetical protein